MLKYVKRYIIFVGIPYAIARKIEKRYLRPKNNSENNSDNNPYNKPDNNPDNKPDNLALGSRGGEIFTAASITALLTKDFAARVGVAGLFGSTVWCGTADNAIEQILRYSSAIAAAPGHKFVKVIKRFRSIDDKYALAIKEILLAKDMSNEEKYELIKLKVQYTLKNIRGKKRVAVISATVALLVFFLGNGTPAFAYFMGNLREIMGGENDQDSLKSYIIDIYKEYNAPLPKELITQIANEL